MRFQGKLSSWNDTKGIGTITWNGGSSDRVFVHISAFTSRRKRPSEGDVVIYEVEKDGSGRFRAVNVSFPQRLTGSTTKTFEADHGIFIGCITVTFAGCLLFSVLTGRAEFLLLVLYAFASAITVIAYSIDKRAAEQGQWRIPERTLHLMALLGGWPGAYAAQRVFRHKIAKRSFQSIFVITVFLNICVLILSSSPAALRAVTALLAR